MKYETEQLISCILFMAMVLCLMSVLISGLVFHSIVAVVCFAVLSVILFIIAQGFD